MPLVPLCAYGCEPKEAYVQFAIGFDKKCAIGTKLMSWCFIRTYVRTYVHDVFLAVSRWCRCAFLAVRRKCHV